MALLYVVLVLMFNPVSKGCNSLVYVISFKSGIINDGLNTVLHSIKIETLWGAVVLIHRVSEDLSSLSCMVEEGAPEPFHLLLCEATDLVLVIKSGKEPGIKSHFGKESWSST